MNRVLMIFLRLFLVWGLTNFELMAGFDRDSSAQIVTDSTTGLSWQDDMDAKTKQMLWGSSISYCESLTLGGYSDWRLPNINELKTIIDTSGVSPAISYHFENVSSDDYYWSSTTSSSYKYSAFVVYSANGFVFISPKNYSSFLVRCVRGGQ